MRPLAEFGESEPAFDEIGQHIAAFGFIAIDRFNYEAAEAIRVQAGMISQQSRDFLELLRLKLEIDELTLVHGS
ncbi:MAG TPA: hypothetical protein PKO06_12695, partial [Candidatus Ozemobacteraceae bacterium]|nr:hypothetical protein [Candidatus Ozemobacteraceae bacterium]